MNGVVAVMFVEVCGWMPCGSSKLECHSYLFLRFWSMFTDLLSGLLFSVFHEWIAVKEVCLLNSACCNKVVRPLIEAVLLISCEVETGINLLSIPTFEVTAKSARFPVNSLVKSVVFVGSDGRQLRIGTKKRNGRVQQAFGFEINPQYRAVSLLF